MGIWGKAYASGGPQMTMSRMIPMASNVDQTFFQGFVQSSVHHHAAQVHSNVSAAVYPPAQEHPMVYVGIYTAISFATGFAAILAVITQYLGALRASRILFDRLLTTVVRATMRWHVSGLIPARIRSAF